MNKFLKTTPTSTRPIFDHIRAVMAVRLFEPTAAPIPIPIPESARITEEEMIDRIQSFILRGMKYREYSYDPLEGKFSFRFVNRFNLDQLLTTGVRASDFIRDYLMKEEYWDEVSFINFANDGFEGRIIMTSKQLTNHAICSSIVKKEPS